MPVPGVASAPAEARRAQVLIVAGDEPSHTEAGRLRDAFAETCIDAEVLLAPDAGVDSAATRRGTTSPVDLVGIGPGARTAAVAAAADPDAWRTVALIDPPAVHDGASDMRGQPAADLLRLRRCPVPGLVIVRADRSAYSPTSPDSSTQQQSLATTIGAASAEVAAAEQGGALAEREALTRFWAAFDGPPALRLALEGHPSEVTRARHALRGWLADATDGTCDTERLFDAELLASELVTNAALHAQAPIQMHVALRGPYLTVQVDDAGVGDLVEGRTHHGRGLGLVSSLAHRCGAWRRPEGLSVWFWLALGQPVSPGSCTAPVLGSNASHGSAGSAA